MPMVLTQMVAELVERHSANRTIHALIEVCYERAHWHDRVSNLYDAEAWAALGQALTQAEGLARTRDL